MREDLLKFDEPDNYFAGRGKELLPSPMRVLMFLRESKNKLQQHALQNRSHHRCVLIFNLGTEGHIHLDDMVLPFKPGQALQILPYQFHHYSGLISAKLRWLFCTFEIEDQNLLEPLRDRILDTNTALTAQLEQLLEIWRMPPTGLQASRLQASLLGLLLSLRQAGEESNPKPVPEAKDNLLRRVNMHMAQSDGSTVGIAGIADAMGYSESRLRVIFKRVAGITLGAYIKNYRLNRAMALLRTTDLSISEIARQAGFASPQAFSRTFKKETGNTPRSYRGRD